MDMNTVLAIILGTNVVSVPSIVVAIRKWGPQVKSVEAVVKKDAPVVVGAFKEAEHAVEDVLKLPELATVRMHLDAKKKELRDSELVKVAAVALHGYEKGLDALTANEKGTLLAFVRTSLAKVGVEATDQEIVKALQDAQQLAESFKQTDAFKNTAALEESLKALSSVESQPAQPAS